MRTTKENIRKIEHESQSCNWRVTWAKIVLRELTQAA